MEPRLGPLLRRRAAGARDRVPGDVTATAAAGAPSPAVAPPPGNPRFALFDSLRAIAVLGVLTFHACRPLGGAQPAGAGRRRRRARQPGADPLLRHLGLPALPAVRRRAGGGPAGAPHRPLPAPARPAHRARLLAGADRAGDLPRGRRGLQRRLVALLPVPAALLQRHRRRRHPGRVDAVRRGVLLSRRCRCGRSACGDCAASSGALALVALFGVAVQVAAARNVVSDLLATNLLGQCTWLALGMALAVAQRRRRARRGRLAARAHRRRAPGPVLAGRRCGVRRAHGAAATGRPVRHRPGARHASNRSPRPWPRSAWAWSFTRCSWRPRSSATTPAACRAVCWPRRRLRGWAWSPTASTSGTSQWPSCWGCPPIAGTSGLTASTSSGASTISTPCSCSRRPSRSAPRSPPSATTWSSCGSCGSRSARRAARIERVCARQRVARPGQPPDDEPAEVVVGARSCHPAREVECGPALAVRHEHQGDHGAVARVAAAIGRGAGDGGGLGQRHRGRPRS